MGLRDRYLPSVLPHRNRPKLLKILGIFLEWKILHIRVHAFWHILWAVTVGQDPMSSYRFFEIKQTQNHGILR